MEEITVDFEDMCEQAWREFRGVLADALDALETGEHLLVELDAGDLEDGAAPYIQALRTEEILLLEVSSNCFLSDRYRLDKAARRHMRDLGLAKTTNYAAAFAPNGVDQVASIAADALRDGFGIVHPALLISEGIPWLTAPPVTPTPWQEPDSVRVPDRAQLDALVDQALAPLFGHVMKRDSDGDIPIRAGSAVVFVRSFDDEPILRLFSMVAVDVADREAALREVNALNTAIESVKFVFYRDVVIASVDLPAMPFAPQQLRTMVARMCEAVSANDAELARRVHGRVFTSSAPEPDQEEAEGIHPVMQCMLQIEADKPGSLRPKIAAKLCDYDRNLILELIYWNEEQEIAWREARDEASDAEEREEADACEHERAHAERTIKILRKALRKVLLEDSRA